MQGLKSVHSKSSPLQVRRTNDGNTAWHPPFQEPESRALPAHLACKSSQASAAATLLQALAQTTPALASSGSGGIFCTFPGLLFEMGQPDVFTRTPPWQIDRPV